jgi:hypothetical protein
MGVYKSNANRNVMYDLRSDFNQGRGWGGGRTVHRLTSWYNLLHCRHDEVAPLIQA